MRFIKWMSVAALALVVGCISDTSGVRMEGKTLIVDNAAFASHMRIIEEIRNTTPDGFLDVQATLQNDDTCDIKFQYRFQWLDANGMLINDATPVWRRATAHGKDKLFLKAVGSSVDAKDFRIVIREI